MRAKRILDGLNGLQPGEDVTATQIIHWIIDALDVSSNVPDVTINSAGKVRTSLLRHLCAKIAQKKFALNTPLLFNNLSRVATAVKKVFRKTVENGNSLRCWCQVGSFLNDLLQLSNDSFCMVVIGAISITLMKELTKVPNFDMNEETVDTMLVLYKCGVVIPNNWEIQRKISKHLKLAYVKYMEELIEIIGKVWIFSSDDFFAITEEMIFNGLRKTSSRTGLCKYLDAVLLPLVSTNQAAITNMATFLRRPNTTELLMALLGRKESNVGVKILKILRAILMYSRKTSAALDIDWVTVFARTLYCHNDAVDLLLLEAQGAEPNEDLKSRNLMERMVQIYLRLNDSFDEMPARELENDNVRGFIDLIHNNINFQDCDQLFFLLRKYIVENPAECAVVILFIKNAAKILEDQPTSGEDYSKLMKKTYEHIKFVKRYPELLSRLLNIFNKSKFNSDQALREEILSIVPGAFHRSDQYRTAVDLLQILKVVGFGNDKIVNLYEMLLVQLVSGDRLKETLVLVLAASDVFDIFEKIEPTARRHAFDMLKSGLDGTGDDEEALCASLMVHMLAAIHSTTDTTEAEGAMLHKFLLNAIEAAEEQSFAAVHLGIAICVYNTIFTPKIDGLPISLDTLAKRSVDFRLNYEGDANQDPTINDLRLLEKYWRSAIAVFKQRIPESLIPSVIFETYLHIEINLAGQAEEFIKTILQYGDTTERYHLFALTVYSLVKDVSKCEATVKKLIKFAESNVSQSDATGIAQRIFSLLLSLLVSENFQRHETVYAIQTNLYKNHIQENVDAVRRNVMDELDAEINKQRGDIQKRLQGLRNRLRPTANEVPDKQMSDDEQSDEEMEDDEQSDEEMEDDEIL